DRPAINVTHQMIDACCGLEQAAMRTILSIDDDVLTAAKALAARRNTTVGAVVSELRGTPCGVRRRDGGETAYRFCQSAPRSSGAAPVRFRPAGAEREACDWFGRWGRAPGKPPDLAPFWQRRDPSHAYRDRRHPASAARRAGRARGIARAGPQQ